MGIASKKAVLMILSKYDNDPDVLTPVFLGGSDVFGLPSGKLSHNYGKSPF